MERVTTRKNPFYASFHLRTKRERERERVFFRSCWKREHSSVFVQPSPRKVFAFLSWKFLSVQAKLKNLKSCCAHFNIQETFEIITFAWFSKTLTSVTLHPQWARYSDCLNMSYLRDSHSSNDNWVLFEDLRSLFRKNPKFQSFVPGRPFSRTWRWLRPPPTSQLWPQSQSCSSSHQPQTFKVRLQPNRSEPNEAKPEKGKYLKSQSRDLSIKIKARSIQQPGDLFAWHTQGHFVPNNVIE